MKNTNPDSLPEKFSEDPQENLRIENEILQLTIKAELGGELMHKNMGLPPEIENEFLKNILAFEHAFADSRQIKVFDLLNQPVYKKSAELDDEEISNALKSIVSILEAKDIVVEYMADYDDRLKYEFITDELFEHEMNDVQISGMVTHFCYEEFHPNHQLDIEQTATDFIDKWIANDLEEYGWGFADPIILPDGRTISREDMLARLKRIFESYPEFKNCKYDVISSEFKFLDDGTGLGNVEGIIKYTATLESGESIEISGLFKFYLCFEYGYWFIMYFIFPGFNWD